MQGTVEVTASIAWMLNYASWCDEESEHNEGIFKLKSLKVGTSEDAVNRFALSQEMIAVEENETSNYDLN